MIFKSPHPDVSIPSVTIHEFVLRHAQRLGNKAALIDGPSGRTLTYLDVARRLRTAPRPVGGACGANRIPLVIPCHRVVASGGLGGFMKHRGGFPLEVKRWLLKHEGAEAVMGNA